MPPKFLSPQLTIGTCSQNKNAHPGKPVFDAGQSRRSKQDMQEVHAREAQQAEEEKARLVNGLKQLRLKTNYFKRMFSGVPPTTRASE